MVLGKVVLAAAFVSIDASAGLDNFLLLGFFPLWLVTGQPYRTGRHQDHERKSRNDSAHAAHSGTLVARSDVLLEHVEIPPNGSKTAFSALAAGCDLHLHE
ncbi:MAG: hypothetical protein IPK83_05405 [Planctomycetes bacterium]|nr:hypothetical protein [Planctomycetota bacterium]